MKKILLALVVVLVATTAHASTVIRVGEVISGVEYVEVLKRGVKRDLSFDATISDAGENIGVEEDEDIGGGTFPLHAPGGIEPLKPRKKIIGAHLQFHGDTSLGRAGMVMPYYKETQKELEDAVMKAIEWGGIAKKNKVDVNLKGLDIFGDIMRTEESRVSREGGVSYRKNEMGFAFYSTGRGKSMGMLITINDWENQFIRASIQLDESGVHKLLANIRKIDATVKKALAASKKEELFK